MKIRATLFFSVSVFYSFTQASAQQIASTGAEGTGRYAIGGKGTATRSNVLFNVSHHKNLVNA